MSEFNRMTIVAAVEVIAEFHSHDDMHVLEVQWDIDSNSPVSSKAARVASWAKKAVTEDIKVLTRTGEADLARALVELAITAPKNKRESDCWFKLVAGLKFDGFEIQEVIDEEWNGWGQETETYVLERMLPEDIPELNFGQSKSEVERLLDVNNLAVAKGHLQQGVSAFHRGDWAAANSQIRTFFESFLMEIAEKLGMESGHSLEGAIQFLGQKVDPLFFSSEYNEYSSDSNKQRYIRGLVQRLHPHGPHPGLSEIDDAIFRLQITMITARLLLRRLAARL